jgi:hypothetical protein
MLHIVIILGWLIAIGFVVYLAPQAARRRLSGRKQRKHTFRKLREFRRHHGFDQKHQRWVRNDGVVLIDDVSEDRRLTLVVLGWLLFVLWEGYWFWEIAQRFSETTRRGELPYVFLFLVLIVIPLAVFLFVRRRLRRSAQLLPARRDAADMERELDRLTGIKLPPQK